MMTASYQLLEGNAELIENKDQERRSDLLSSLNSDIIFTATSFLDPRSRTRVLSVSKFFRDSKLDIFPLDEQARAWQMKINNQGRHLSIIVNNMPNGELRRNLISTLARVTAGHSIEAIQP